MDVAYTGFAGGHSGKNRTMDRLELAYWWPGIHYDVETFISKCVRCQELSGRKPQPSSLQSLPICEEPNFRVLLAPYVVALLQGRNISVSYTHLTLPTTPYV